MVKNQMSHQESETANIQKLTSNPVPLLPKPALWFHLSWVEVITIPLIMIMFRFALHSFQLNLPLNLFHIKTPPRSSKFKMMKWTISWNSYTQSMMMIFWVFTSRCFRLDWWLPLFQNFIHNLLCCFINMWELMMQSQIACHAFLCLSQPSPMWNWLMETRDMPKELGLFYVNLLSVLLYI